jgi:hypothetical protein
MLANTHAEENGSHMPSPQASRFLNARIAPFAQGRRFRSHPHSIGRITSKSSGAQGGGMQFRCCDLMQRISPHFTHRNCRHVRLGLNPCVTISTDFF